VGVKPKNLALLKLFVNFPPTRIFTKQVYEGEIATGFDGGVLSHIIDFFVS
jgi:hypothetical protein